MVGYGFTKLLRIIPKATDLFSHRYVENRAWNVEISFLIKNPASSRFVFCKGNDYISLITNTLMIKRNLLCFQILGFFHQKKLWIKCPVK